MELFSIGFLDVTIFDVLDIVLVGLIFYWLYRALRDTIAVQILFGLVILIGLRFITEAVNLKAINWILDTIQSIWLLAFIILFQPELRKLMLLITRSPVFQLFMRNKNTEALDEIVDAVIEMSDKHIGCLIVFPRSQNVQMTIDTGIPLQANVSTELLLSIFITRSPLHDGAVVIENQNIVAARCVLPLSSVTKASGRNLGTRHRAALGLAEQSDALILIVSEETGWISIAEAGKISFNKKKDELKKILDKRFYSRAEKSAK